uniref:CASP-like protein 4C1 n=1 Tax=Pteridium aquilinum subsp. aquilinum TaxID=104588 RepID=CSPL2_PTEAA|nr:RecName: Full=CASP-like protein 4C1; Short=PaCASPL4C1 [Pteridium aquilinum subsp. aquilinum]
MDSPESSDRGLNPMTPDHGGHNGKVVHYFGQGVEGGPASPRKLGHGHLHPKANTALLLLRLLTFAFSLASLVIMATNSATTTATAGRHRTVNWVDFDTYRYVLAACAIVCLYSFAEIGLGLWYLLKGRMVMPESMAHWFDFGHDQGFAYLIFSACSGATAVAHNLRERHILIHGMYGCDEANSFCMKAEISIGLAFGAFLFIALSSLLSGYRLVKWLILGP